MSHHANCWLGGFCPILPVKTVKMDHLDRFLGSGIRVTQMDHRFAMGFHPIWHLGPAAGSHFGFPAGPDPGDSLVAI